MLFIKRNKCRKETVDGKERRSKYETWPVLVLNKNLRYKHHVQETMIDSHQAGSLNDVFVQFSTETCLLIFKKRGTSHEVIPSKYNPHAFATERNHKRIRTPNKTLSFKS